MIHNPTFNNENHKKKNRFKFWVVVCVCMSVYECVCVCVCVCVFVCVGGCIGDGLLPIVSFSSFCYVPLSSFFLAFPAFTLPFLWPPF